MPSKISFQNWSYGSGSGDLCKLIGYCQEEPKDVLEVIHQQYLIYDYCGLRRPVDYAYPNNVEGLVIEKVSDFDLRQIGIASVLPLSDLDISRALFAGAKRDEQTFIHAMDAVTKMQFIQDWMMEGKSIADQASLKAQNAHYTGILDEVRSVLIKH